MSKQWNDTAIEIILNEGEQYLPEGDIALIVVAYKMLVEAVNFHDRLKESHLELSLEIASHTVDLGIKGEYIAASLLYFPFVVGVLGAQHLQSSASQGILFVLRSLANVGTIFEDYLPWIERTVPSNKSEYKPSEKSKYWRNQALATRPNAFLAIASSPEIVIIKLLERLYLLKLLPKFSLHKDLEQVIARDGIDLFSPVAESIGMWMIKSQIEDSAFKLLEPKIYKEIASDLNKRKSKRLARLQRALAILSDLFQKENLDVEITGRAKHLFGIYQKMLQTGKTVQQINDRLGIRIIVNSGMNEEEKIKNCYQVLSLLFQTWPPVQGIYEGGKMYRDWIRTPKPNGYQSLHTTVEFENELLEVQIRTRAMHDWAELGAAAHWLYKKTGQSNALRKKYQQYVSQVGLLRKDYEKMLEGKRGRSFISP